MTGTTPRGYPYPLTTDGPFAPAQFQALATAVDTDMTAAIASRGIVVAPASTSTNGTATSGTTETRDAVFGNYVFTAVAGVRYQAVIEGLNLLCTVANDRFAINIRTGGASTPTASSTLWGTNSTFWVPANNSTFTTWMSPSFIPGAGTQTLSIFVVRLSGTGIATPTGARVMYASAIGTV